MGSLSELDDRLKSAGDMNSSANQDGDARSDVDDDFTTPPTSAPHTPSRSRAQTVVKDVWFVKPGGLLDLSRSETSSLNPNTCSTVASQHQVRQIQLHHNPITSMPIALSSFSSTLSFLSLAHAQLTGESYITETLELPALRELSLLSNQISSLTPLTKFLQAPTLEKLDVSINRMSSLPTDLKQVFPQLTVLLAASNQLSQLDPDWIRGLKIVDASSNDLGQLNPRLGLLGGVDGLQRLEVAGNRFRVPRWSILEQGTEATLKWLRGRLPAEEMAAWRAANDEDSGEDMD
jgi:Leucine-rich repeat (LRR) protein